MEKENKPHPDPQEELAALRQRVRELEALDKERRKTEQALRESEAKYRSIIENIEEGYYEVDLRGNVTFFNDRVCEILGYERDELMGMNFRQFHNQESATRAFEAFNRVYRTGRAVKMFDYEVIRKDGVKRHLEVSISLIPDAEEGESVFRGIARDVTERKMAEEALRRAQEELEKRVEERTRELVQANEALKKEIAERESAREALRDSEEKYRNTIECLDDGYYEADTAGNIIFCNEALCRMIGYEQSEILGSSFRRFTDEENARLIERISNSVLETGKPAAMFGWDLLRCDGTVRNVESSISLIRDADGNPVGFRGLVTDVTERKRAREELARIQKLESIGVLAGGIAHDFNNILTAIQGNISLARLYADPDSKVTERLEAAERASVRARDLTQQLLTFAKGGAPIKTRASVADLLHDTCEFVLRGSNVRCEINIAEDTWAVEIDKLQMGQAIGNVVINADQAMPAGGVIKVRAGNVSLGADSGIPLQPGDYVRICIEDRGVGMDEETLTKVLDPYFTTKPTASGLGLTAAFSIVTNHGGHLSLESRPGVGTRVYLYLPAVALSAEEIDGVPESLKTVPGTGRILVMDDEEPIRELASELLSMLGFEVETAKDGVEAVQLYSQSMGTDRPFDVVILDLTVPGGMGGKETMERLLGMDPDVRAIVSSGYSNDPIMANYGDFGFSGVIPKPYSAAQMSKVLRRVMESVD